MLTHHKSEESSDNSLDQNCTLLRKKIRNSQKKNGDKPVEIFAALLNTTPNTTENKESRTRHRYAKIAALIEAGYSPSEEPNPMHYCRIGTPDAHDKKYNVGWEHFIFMPRPNKEPDSDEKDEKSDVILVWLGNNLFNDKNFKQKNEGNKFLASLINESEKCTNTKNNLYLFDWNHTILDWDYLFKKYAHIRKTHDVHKHIKNSKIIPIVPANYPIKIVQPLRSTLEHSKELIQKLTDELITYRRISALSEIAIIVEQDTQYVRELSNKFESTLSENLATEYPKNNPPSNTIKRFSYYKGLDAHQQSLEKEEENFKPKRWNEDGYLSSVDLRNPSFGPAQFDYLQRIAAQINNSHKTIDIEKRVGGIKAVVIFGSDYYDKLLILQALRSEMTNILILTTDLDARMLHPQYFRWTRNLIVASPFGLQLPQNKQSSFSAFRDSQQTEIFYNVKQLIEKSSIAGPPPVLFEIGRNNYVHLPQSSDETERIKEILPQEMFNQNQNKHQFWLLSFITSALIFLLYGFRPNSFRLCSYIAASAGVIFYIYYQAIEKNEEPLSFTEGISLWPAVFIQIIAIALALYFYYSAYFKSESMLRRNFEYLQLKFCIKNNSNNNEQTTDTQWHIFIGITFIILLISIVGYVLNDIEPDGFVNLKFCIISLFIFILIFIYLEESHFKPHLIAITHWNDKAECYLNNPKTPKLIESEQIWNEYNRLGQWRPYLIRITLMWLVFALIETILFYLVPSWPQSVRGNSAFDLDWFVGITSFIVIMLLTFVVLDTYRLNYYFIRKLRIQHPLIVEDIYLTRVAESDTCNKTQKELAEMKYASLTAPHKKLEEIITLVAGRTRVVDGLIYYPLICIILMLLARISYFDNQDFPYSKAISFGVSISLLIFAGFMIRSEAEKLKFSVIRSAESLKMKFKHQAADIDTTIEKISSHP